MKNVSAKVLKVIAAVNGKVAKSGYNSFQKYAYVMEKDLLDAVREELVKNNLLIMMSVEHISRVKDLTTVRTKHTIVDTLSGETLEVWSAGEGKDATKDDVGGDKAAPKAITSASKYFWLKFFLLSGNDDPENDDEEHKSNASNKVPAKMANTTPAGKPQAFVAKAPTTPAPAPKQAQQQPQAQAPKPTPSMSFKAPGAATGASETKPKLSMNMKPKVTNKPDFGVPKVDLSSLPEPSNDNSDIDPEF